LRVVICGSFKRALPQLRQDFQALRERFEVLSPLSLDFVNPSDDFVRLVHERNESQNSIEHRHLQALADSDFVWLHSPEGYIGNSSMWELGCAQTLGIPIFASTTPTDSTFAPYINVVSGPDAVEVAPEVLSPGNGLRALQHYYDRAAARRGWSGETAQDTLLLLTEEIGELARAVRKSVGLARDGDWDGQDVGEELADVQLYVVHLANVLGVDLASAVTGKELVNAARVAARHDVA
jgi:NTP pyrophosphatase (non-canonical NTP hydrolase)